jgi:uncharacterized protein (UPF0248 family)
MEDDKPVYQDAYNELKLLAALGENCTLRFRADNGGIVTTETTITDVFEEDETHYVLAGNGLTLPLHRLIAINGKPLEYLC